LSRRRPAAVSGSGGGVLTLGCHLLAGGVEDVLRADADAVLHVEHRAVDGDSIQERGGEVGVVKKLPPFAEPQLRGEDAGGVLVPASHEVEKQPRLFLVGGDVADFVDIC